MATVYEVPAGKLITATAKDLKENIKLKKPDWAMFVKTGSHKDRIPEDTDWWWMRAASVLRKVYVDGPVGVSRLRVAYGGKKNCGVKPDKFRKAAGKNLRVILQDLDKAGLTEKIAGGRKITAKGQAYLDKIAGEIQKSA